MILLANRSLRTKYLGLKPKANSQSPLKRTKNRAESVFNLFQQVFAISLGILFPGGAAEQSIGKFFSGYRLRMTIGQTRKNNRMVMTKSSLSHRGPLGKRYGLVFEQQYSSDQRRKLQRGQWPIANPARLVAIHVLIVAL